MAETQRVSPPSAPPVRQPTAPKPRPRHRVRYAAPLRLPLDETQDLRPPAPAVEPEAAREPQEARTAVEERPAARERHHPRPSRPPARTPAERALLTVLVLGLGLNAALLLLDAALTRADVLLGSTVLLSGVVLLALLEICRRGGPHSSMD